MRLDRQATLPRLARALGGLAMAALATAPYVAAQRPRASERAWRASDVVVASAFTAALWIDAAQTREAVRRGYTELNPVLGEHPTIGRVNGYTALVGLTTLGVAAALPGRPRLWLLAAGLAVETASIAANSRAGIALRF